MSAFFRRSALRRLVTIGLPAVVITVSAFGLLFLIRPQLLPTIESGAQRLVRIALSRPPAITQRLDRGGLAVLDASSLEYRYEFAFPFDFFPGGSADWRTLARLDEQQRAGAQLSPQEEEYVGAYRLAQEIGITPKSLPPRAIIVTIVADAGFASSRFRAGGWLSSQGWTAVVRMPDPSITHVKVVGSDPQSTSQPSASLTPAEWRKVVLFVSERARTRLIRSGILVDARRSGQALLRAYLRAEGFSTVRFVDADAVH